LAGLFVWAGDTTPAGEYRLMRWLLIDGFNLAFRSHFGMERLGLKRADGFPTGALHGWIRMLWSIEDTEKPQRMIVFFDLGGSDRHLAAHPEYKAQRADTPEDLEKQIPEIKKLTQNMGLTIVEQRGVEADDLIASAAQRLSGEGHEVVIVSADKDFGQCVGGKVFQLTPPTPASDWRRLDAAGVFEKFGIYPERIPDYLALVGDSVDNIPGLKGVGPKTAVKWLTEFADLEGVLSAADKLEPARFREQVVSEAARIRANLSLVRFKTDFPCVLDSAPPRDAAALEAYLAGMEMQGTLKKFKQREAERIAKSQGELF
jgi:DNA polymerase-1